MTESHMAWLAPSARDARPFETVGDALVPA
jgi:hypothetical protein